VHYSVYAGLAFAALFGMVGPYLARRLSPALAAWMLSTGGIVSALSGVGALALLSMTLVSQSPPLAAAGHWSITTLRRIDPVRLPVAATAIGLLAFGLSRFAWVAFRRGQALAAAHRLNQAVPDTGSDLVVLPDPTPDAYAVPGRPGRVFVTRGMLRLLTTEEYGVMLAHERSHLRHRHHWHRTVVLLASALNPLLVWLPRTQGWVTERWADEDAARGSDRAVVASALSRAADATGSGMRPTSALALATRSVDSRVAAMLAEPPRHRPLMLAIALAILVLSVSGTLDGFTDEAHLFHLATLGHYPHLGHLRHVIAHSVSTPFSHRPLRAHHS
jgi:Zn-dependent protease with chaperone function